MVLFVHSVSKYKISLVHSTWFLITDTNCWSSSNCHRIDCFSASSAVHRTQRVFCYQLKLKKTINMLCLSHPIFFVYAMNLKPLSEILQEQLLDRCRFLDFVWKCHQPLTPCMADATPPQRAFDSSASTMQCPKFLFQHCTPVDSKKPKSNSAQR